MELRVENEANYVTTVVEMVPQQLQKSFTTMSFSAVLFNYAIQGKS